MSQENMEIVRRVYEAGDLGSALRDAHPDFEFTFKAGPNAGTHRGREEAQALLSDLSPLPGETLERANRTRLSHRLTRRPGPGTREPRNFSRLTAREQA
jgi:hypothetical protein